MLSALGQVFIGVPFRIAADISSSLYSGLQRIVALTVLTNQRFSYSSSAMQELKTRRLTILSTAEKSEESSKIPTPHVAQVQVENENGDILQGIVMGPKDKILVVDGKPKVKDRLLVAFSGIGGCYEKWYFDGLKDLYENFNTSILLVNYRGVGESSGRVVTPNDLLADGYAIAMYAYKELSLDPAKIHFYGASMGGGVATNVVVRLEKEGYKPASVCIDRSYSYLMQTVHDMLPFDFLKAVAKKLMMYTSWQIDSVQAALQIAYAKLVVIRHQADSVIPVNSSLATALEDKVVGKAPFKLIDLPQEEKTEYEKLFDGYYPYWVRLEMESTYRGLIRLKYLEIESCVQKFFIGIRAHCVPFSRDLYPLQTEVYHKVLIDAEKPLLLEN
jgi:alpha/beta superfamily hydrolase